MSTSPDLLKLLDSTGYTEAEPLAAYIKTGEYSFEACRRLLKVYQFQPALVDTDMYASVLLLGLMQYPKTDFASLASMVPEQTTEPIMTIVQCADHLDACQFAAFWEALKTLEQHSAHVVIPNTDQLRVAITSVLALTYRTAPLAVVTAALNAAPTVGPYVEAVDATTVTFCATPNNTKRGQVFQEGVSFSAICTMMHKTMVSQ